MVAYKKIKKIIDQMEDLRQEDEFFSGTDQYRNEPSIPMDKTKFVITPGFRDSTGSLAQWQDYVANCYEPPEEADERYSYSVFDL